MTLEISEGGSGCVWVCIACTVCVYLRLCLCLCVWLSTCPCLPICVFFLMWCVMGWSGIMLSCRCCIPADQPTLYLSRTDCTNSIPSYILICYCLCLCLCLVVYLYSHDLLTGWHATGKRFAEEEFVLLLAIMLSRFSVSLPPLEEGETRVPLMEIPTLAQVGG